MSPTTILSIISFAPAFILLYWVLGKYTGYFKDNKALLMVILGLGIGLILGFTTFFFPLDVFLWTMAIIFLTELIKLILFLQKPFRLNHDTTFYGMAFGIGIGAMYVFFNSYYAGLTSLKPEVIIFILLLSINYTSINASTGAIIGYGCYKGEFWRYFFRAFIIHGILGFILTFVWGGLSIVGSFSLMGIGVVYNVLILSYVYNSFLEKTVPDEMKKIKEINTDPKIGTRP